MIESHQFKRTTRRLNLSRAMSIMGFQLTLQYISSEAAKIFFFSLPIRWRMEQEIKKHRLKAENLAVKNKKHLFFIWRNRKKDFFHFRAFQSNATKTFFHSPSKLNFIC